MLAHSDPSILFEIANDAAVAEQAAEPDFFTDLNLDQIVGSIISGRDEYDLAGYFHVPLPTIEAVGYRQDAFDDLQNAHLVDFVESFAQKMRRVRQHLEHAHKVHYQHEHERWLLDAADLYCDAVSALAHDLDLIPLRSRVFLSFRSFLSDHVHTEQFIQLGTQTGDLIASLSLIRYSLDIKGDRVKVTDYQGEPDLSADVAATFEKFRHALEKQYLVEFPESLDLNHVEAAVLDMVAKLNPDVFATLTEYCTRHTSFVDDTIARFDREAQFYLAYLTYMRRFAAAGMQFCRPNLSRESKEIQVLDTFDAALATKLLDEPERLVRNDFFLTGQERILVVTGPNNGDKTTFARMFGQLHYLASLGLPVPGVQARLFLPDRIFSHFEKQEDPTSLHGKLEEDLLRLHDIFDKASRNSVIILNEIFTSTTSADAVFLGTEVINKVATLDALCVCVTFVDELASIGPGIVSAVSTVDPQDPSVRSFKIVRKPADGLAYAAAIAEKYGLSYQRLKQRIRT